LTANRRAHSNLQDIDDGHESASAMQVASVGSISYNFALTIESDTGPDTVAGTDTSGTSSGPVAVAGNVADEESAADEEEDKKPPAKKRRAD
jgi:hypothetical protein